MEERKKMTGEQIINWSRELRDESLESVARSKEARLFAQETELITLKARLLTQEIRLMCCGSQI